MDNNNKHIDQIIREKFNAYSVSPPEHIWAGIEKGISVRPAAYLLWNRRTITISAIVLLALITSIILFNPLSTVTSDNDSKLTPTEENITLHSDINVVIPNSEENITDSDIETNTSDPITIESGKPLVSEEQLSGTNNTNSYESNAEQLTIDKPINSGSIAAQNNQGRDNIDHVNIIKMKKSAFINPEIYSNDYIPENRDFTQYTQDEILIDPTIARSDSRWRIGYYIAPELSISNFDSVQILNSYTLSVEPTYFFNEHWFVRFGLGISYVRDRGFANISYLTNEYMGSYDDVYDITFDTVSGNIIPVYHTKTVEVWDSVRHVSVSEVTNKYVYLQVPALFGYYHNKPGSDFSWYLFGGPAFNIKIGSWIDDPKPDDEDADIIDLQNKLPIRSNNYFQLWLGAGLEYEVNKKISIAVEPGYRYYFKSIYSEPYNATSSSGFSLRVGIVYNLK